MDRNGESIYGTRYGPIQGLSSVRTTAKGRDLFAHIFDWPGTTLQLSASNLSEFRSAALLASGEAVAFRQDNRYILLNLAAQASDPDVTVLKMRAA
jgi:alpha-L-fucosidase